MRSFDGNMQSVTALGVTFCLPPASSRKQLEYCQAGVCSIQWLVHPSTSWRSPAYFCKAFQPFQVGRVLNGCTLCCCVDLFACSQYWTSPKLFASSCARIAEGEKRVNFVSLRLTEWTQETGCSQTKEIWVESLGCGLWILDSRTDRCTHIHINSVVRTEELYGRRGGRTCTWNIYRNYASIRNWELRDICCGSKWARKDNCGNTK